MSEDITLDYPSGCGDKTINLNEYSEKHLVLNFINDEREGSVSQFMVDEDINNDSIRITRISGIPTSNSVGLPINNLVVDHITINNYFTLGRNKITFKGQNYTDEEIVTTALEDAISYAEAKTSIAFNPKSGISVVAGEEFQGSFLNEKIKGTSSSDTIYGNEGNDSIDGSSGDDIIYGGSGDDILSGSAGNDTIYAQSGKNTISGGNGNDTIYGADEGDSITPGQGSDIVYAGKGDDKIYANTSLANGDRNTIYANDGDDTIYSSGASIEKSREVVNNKLIKHLTSADTVNTIYGEGGSDRFIIQGLYGAHIIKDATSEDKLEHSLIEGTEYSYERDGNNLKITQTYTDALGDIQIQTIVLENHFTIENPIEKMTVGDVEKEFMSEVTLNITLSEDEPYIASKYPEVITGSGTVEGLNSSDTIVMDGDVTYSRYNSNPDLIISNGEENITVKNYFSKNNTFDKIIVNEEELSIKEQTFNIYVTDNYDGLLANENIINNAKDNLTISGHGGNNVYRFQVNSADTTLYLSGDSDSIIFEKDTTSVALPISSELSYIEDGEDLIIRRVSKYNLQVGSKVIESETVNNVVVKGFVKEANSSNASITVQLENEEPVILSSQTFKLSGNEEIIATSFNEEITGSLEADVIYAGQGKDIINPLEGENTIVFNVGDAVDKNTINSVSNSDTIQFIDKNGYENSYSIEYTDNVDNVTSLITRTAVNTEDEDDNTIDLIEINNSSKDNILLFGKGKNHITFSEDNFLYDTTISTHGDDILDFGDLEIAINPSINSKDIIITLKNSENTGSVIIKDYLEDKNSDAKVIAYDIPSQKLSQIQINTALIPDKKGVIQGTYAAEIINGTDGKANTIYGESGNDIITGGRGSDKIYAGEGDNTIIFNIGDGKDLVYSDGGYDTLEFYGISENDNFKLIENQNNLIISYGNKGDSVTLVDFLKGQEDHSAKALKVYSSAQEEDKVLNNKYTILDLTANRTDFLVVDGSETKKTTVAGSSLPETIIGSNKNNIIKGGGGDDIIYAYNGNNKIQTQSKEGDNTTIYLGAGKDKVYTGSGTDTLIFRQGHSSDTIIANTNGNAILDFSSAGDLSFSLSKKDLIIKNTYDISGTGKLVTENTAIKNYLNGNLTDNISIIDNTGIPQNLYQYITELQENNPETITLGNSAKKKSQNITGSFLNETLYGGQKKDIIKTGAGLDTVYASAGNDKIYGYMPTDVDEYDNHAKTFVFNVDYKKDENGDIISAVGKGSDTIYNAKSSDKIIFSVDCEEIASYISQNTLLKKVKNNLVIVYNTYKKGKKTISDSITIANYFKMNEENAINSIEFEDINASDLSAYNIDISSKPLYISASGKISDTRYFDIIRGSKKNDAYTVVNGGYDTIYDVRGNDTYNITLKDGASVDITDNAGKDTLNFKDASSIVFGINIDALGNIADDKSILLFGYDSEDDEIEGYIKINNYVKENDDGTYTKGKGAIETFRANNVKISAFDLTKIDEIKSNVATFFSTRISSGYTDTLNVLERDDYSDIQALINCYKV